MKRGMPGDTTRSTLPSFVPECNRDKHEWLPAVWGRVSGHNCQIRVCKVCGVREWENPQFWEWDDLGIHAEVAMPKSVADTYKYSLPSGLPLVDPLPVKKDPPRRSVSLAPWEVMWATMGKVAALGVASGVIYAGLARVLELVK